MDASTSSQSRPSAEAPQYVSRIDVRRAVFDIVRRFLLQRLVRRSPPNAPTRLTKAQRHRAVCQSNLLEDILYRRAACLEEYGDPSTLEERVYKAGRAVYVNAQRREMDRESARRAEEASESRAGEEAAERGRRSAMSWSRGRSSGRLRRSESF